jgi:hypothetical protein
MTTLVDEPFSNNIIQTDNLPKIQNLSFEKLSPAYVVMRRKLHFSISFILLIIGFCLYVQPFYTLTAAEKSLVLTIASVIFILSFSVSIYLSYADKHKYYALREQDISYTSGLLFKTVITQPILRIQHVELKQGPIERRQALAKLQLFSAGGALHTFEIPGLTLEKAHSIRQFIIDHKTFAIKQ